MNRWTLSIAGGCGLLIVGCGSSSSSSSTPTPAAVTSASVSSQSAAGSARIVIDPTHGGVGTVVHVTGSGYAPNVTLSGTLCTLDSQGVVENPLTDCDVVDVVTATTDATGGFTATLTVKRIPTKKAGYQIGFGMPGNAAQSAGAAFTVDG